MDGVSGGQLKAVLDVLERAGARVRDSGEEISLKAPKRLYGIQTVTGPYPEFPTDLQSPLMALCATAAGRSVIEETVFEGRFKTADQLARLGASIGVRGRLAEIDGRRILVGGRVEATDLRGGAALVIGGLTAAGITYIGRREYIDRGYEDIVRDLRLLGADIEDSDGYEGKI